MIQNITLSWRKILDENRSTELYYKLFSQIFSVGLEYVIFEMTHWVHLKGRQFKDTMVQALPPVSAVMKEDSNYSLLPKQAGGLSPWCPKSVCPSNSPSGSF